MPAEAARERRIVGLRAQYHRRLIRVRGWSTTGAGRSGGGEEDGRIVRARYHRRLRVRGWRTTGANESSGGEEDRISAWRRHRNDGNGRGFPSELEESRQGVRHSGMTRRALIWCKNLRDHHTTDFF